MILVVSFMLSSDCNLFAQEVKIKEFQFQGRTFVNSFTLQWYWGLWDGMQSFTVQAQGSCQSIPQRMSSMRCRQWIYWFLNDDRLLIKHIMLYLRQ